jgi:hypothetical protein
VSDTLRQPIARSYAQCLQSLYKSTSSFDFINYKASKVSRNAQICSAHAADVFTTPMDKISVHFFGTNVTLQRRMFMSKLKHVYIEHIMRYKYHIYFYHYRLFPAREMKFSESQFFAIRFM